MKFPSQLWGLGLAFSLSSGSILQSPSEEQIDYGIVVRNPEDVNSCADSVKRRNLPACQEHEYECFVLANLDSCQTWMALVYPDDVEIRAENSPTNSKNPVELCKMLHKKKREACTEQFKIFFQVKKQCKRGDENACLKQQQMEPELPIRGGSKVDYWKMNTDNENNGGNWKKTPCDIYRNKRKDYNECRAGFGELKALEAECAKTGLAIKCQAAKELRSQLPINKKCDPNDENPTDKCKAKRKTDPCENVHKSQRMQCAEDLKVYQELRAQCNAEKKSRRSRRDAESQKTGDGSTPTIEELLRKIKPTASVPEIQAVSDLSSSKCQEMLVYRDKLGIKSNKPKKPHPCDEIRASERATCLKNYDLYAKYKTSCKQTKNEEDCAEKKRIYGLLPGKEGNDNQKPGKGEKPEKTRKHACDVAPPRFQKSCKAIWEDYLVAKAKCKSAEKHTEDHKTFCHEKTNLYMKIQNLLTAQRSLNSESDSYLYYNLEGDVINFPDLELFDGEM